MTLKLEIEGKNYGDLAKQLDACGFPVVSHMSTEELIEVVRERLVNEDPPRVLRIVPFSEESTGITVEPVPEDVRLLTTHPAQLPEAQPAPKKRGRPAKSATKELDASENAEAAAALTEAINETIAQDEAVSMEQVVKALNRHKDMCGLVTTRTLMAELVGGSRLTDVNPKDYAKLYNRLMWECDSIEATRKAKAS